MADNAFTDSLRTGQLVEEGDQPWQFYSSETYDAECRPKKTVEAGAAANKAFAGLKRLKSRGFTLQTAFEQPCAMALTAEALVIYHALVVKHGVLARETVALPGGGKRIRRYSSEVLARLAMLARERRKRLRAAGTPVRPKRDIPSPEARARWRIKGAKAREKLASDPVLKAKRDARRQANKVKLAAQARARRLSAKIAAANLGLEKR